MSLQHKVFVCGTLKRGQPNQGFMTDDANGRGQFLCDGRTKEQYPLVIAGSSNVPFCIDKQGHGKHIKGELWEVDDERLQNLDLIEDVPRLYQRQLRVICLEDGQEVEAHMYQLTNYKESLLELPFLDNYDSEGAHNLPFSPPTKKTPEYMRRYYELLRQQIS